MHVFVVHASEAAIALPPCCGTMGFDVFALDAPRTVTISEHCKYKKTKQSVWWRRGCRTCQVFHGTAERRCQRSGWARHLLWREARTRRTATQLHHSRMHGRAGLGAHCVESRVRSVRPKHTHHTQPSRHCAFLQANLSRCCIVYVTLWQMWRNT
jgi:hypothetical protein